MGKPAYHLYHWAWTGLDWLYPPSCGGCGQRGSRWCPDCQKNTRMITAPFCQICGRPLRYQGVCLECQAAPPGLTSLRSWAEFEGPVRNALHQLKYRGDIALGDILARPMLMVLHDAGWGVDLVVPVPTGVARQAERGYNQAALLAWPIALSAGITYRARALIKIRETKSQVGLSVSQRQANVAEAFRANASNVKEKNVLVIDDVATSGATLKACAKALFTAGAKQVYALTLARAVSPGWQV